MFLDADKALDRVSHWTLISKVIQGNIPLVIVRINCILVTDTVYVY